MTRSGCVRNTFVIRTVGYSGRFMISISTSPLKDRVKVSQNWSHGICRKEVTLKWRINSLPWIQPRWGCAVSVCRHRSAHLVSGGRDGKILVHHRRNGFSVEYSGHKQEVNCPGCIGGLMVCGSRDRTARIWTLSSNCPGGTIPMNDKVSVAISPTQSRAQGQRSYSLRARHPDWTKLVYPTLINMGFANGPLHLTGLTAAPVPQCELLCCLGSESQREAGVVDIVYESPFQQLTCGYDAYIRSWDLRLSPRKCVMEWEEPHDSALYCIQTDGNHMIASGSSYDGVIRMWDKWQTRCVEMLQLSSAVSSPVWSPDAALHHSSSWSNSLGGVLGHCPVEKQMIVPLTRWDGVSLANSVVAMLVKCVLNPKKNHRQCHKQSTITPPLCFMVGTTHAEIICSPTLRLTKTLRLKPKISNLD
ncbi:F-box/WD repeat-containing protein 4-like [Oncorhynchus keta]|uniref:F-box/WD repeat-containing protein 4-like n=1 Tax=Oncorhynchus keta TaxID=8018 RepID=UPI00227A9E96|nr:F-box/WD repeat-containing protein 4-like [Oncorhynchus keta]